MRNIAILLLVLGVCGCGDSIENHYSTSAPTPTPAAEAINITVRTADQFGNLIEGKMSLNGKLLGSKEVKLTVPTKGGQMVFDDIPGHTSPSPLAFSSKGNVFEDGDVFTVNYHRIGQVANVCPRAVNKAGLPVVAKLVINGIPVDSESGCLAVDTAQDANIESTATLGIYAPIFFIPSGRLHANETYKYEILFQSADVSVNVATTPAWGEIFVNGRSMGWAKNAKGFMYVPFQSKEEVKISFGDEAGFQTPKTITVKAGSIKPEDNNNTVDYWGLYDWYTNSLACFKGMSNGSSTQAKILVDKQNTLISSGSSPVCIGLKASATHVAKFENTQNYQSKDELTISTASHVGCEGNFMPGERLDCTGEYFYVQPATQRTEFYITVKFTGPFKGLTDYPVLGRFEIEGIQQEGDQYNVSLKLDEKASITILPIGILQPSLAFIKFDANLLSENDSTYDPEKNGWVYKVAYQPPPGAVETCVKSFNQNEVNISSETHIKFDGIHQLNYNPEDLDCQWLAKTGNHVAVPDYLNGFQPAVSQIYIPEGKVLVHADFELPFIPLSTIYQVCINDIPVETGLLLNQHRLGWTNLDQKCVQLDKSRANSLTIEGKGTRKYLAEDPAFSVGSAISIPYANFLGRDCSRRKLTQADSPRSLFGEGGAAF